MFKFLQVKKTPDTPIPSLGVLTAEWLAKDSESPIRILQLNNLPDEMKRRAYRTLLPPGLLARFKIDLISWKGAEGETLVGLKAEPDTGGVQLWINNPYDLGDEFFRMELADNEFNGVDLLFLVLNDPRSPRFATDVDQEGADTMFGTMRRNLVEEERALQAGLAPAQIRASLSASQITLAQLESFLATLGHRSYALEPLTYASAWVFEKRGFAYVRGHKLMDDVHREFQPGGRLHAALDGSTPFRQPDQWKNVRGRAWAIHDGILEKIDSRWENLRMIKQIGRSAGVQTFPEAVY